MTLVSGGFAHSPYSAYLRGYQRADERTRTADLISLRVSQWVLLGFAGSCKSRISKGLCFLRLAACLHRIALPVVSE